jgi:hypothetical protein
MVALCFWRDFLIETCARESRNQVRTYGNAGALGQLGEGRLPVGDTAGCLRY